MRELVVQPFVDGKDYKVIYGLHDEDKPTTGLVTGSAFIEVDTSDSYLFDEENSQWHKVGVSVE